MKNWLLKLLIAWRSMGLRGFLRILTYSLIQIRLNRQAQSNDSSPSTRPGKLLHVYLADHEAYFEFQVGRLEINFLDRGLLRISWEPGNPPVPYAPADFEFPGVEFICHADDGCYRLQTPDLNVTIASDGSIFFRSPQGALLRREDPPLFTGLAWEHAARLQPNECIYGLGEQSEGLNLRPGVHLMWARDPGGSYGPGADPLYMPIPLYLGLHDHGSYLIFYENTYPGSIHIDPTPVDEATQIAHLTARFENGQLRYYFIAGTPQEVLQSYTRLTGRAPLPPWWSLGYHQCRWGYRSADEIRQVAAGFREHNLPISAIHLDIDYMDGYRVFTVNKQDFPDLLGLSKLLAEQDIRLVAILDPGVKRDPGYDIYQSGKQAKAFVMRPDGRLLSGIVWPGWSVYPDFTSPQTRQWWGQYYPRLLNSGIAGFWHDMNEPTSFSILENSDLPISVRHNLEGEGGDHRQAHNIYALQMNRAGFEALRQHQPERRPWLLSRSGWASQQRYAWSWTADTETSWRALRMTIGTVLGLGLSGIPYSGPDIGGFSGSPDAELYLRWFQMAAFMPFFRTHAAIGTSRREPWVYGEPCTGIIREYLALRYRLLPYWYSLAWYTSQTGSPLVRPLFWEHPELSELRDSQDAFLVGPSVLVAPILEPGLVAREVMLPPGEWYDWWDEKHILGGGRHILNTSLDEMPLLVRAGSVLPMVTKNHLTLHIYPGDGDFTLYSDAGDGYGPSRLDHFHLTRTQNLLRLSHRTEGSYPFPYEDTHLHLHGVKPATVRLNGKPMPAAHDLQVGEFDEVEFDYLQGADNSEL